MKVGPESKLDLANRALGAQPHGFEGQRLVVVVPQLYGLAATKRRNQGIGASELDAASLTRGHHPEQGDYVVVTCRANLNTLKAPPLPPLIPAGEPLEKGIRTR